MRESVPIFLQIRYFCGLLLLGRILFFCYISFCPWYYSSLDFWRQKKENWVDFFFTFFFFMSTLSRFRSAIAQPLSHLTQIETSHISKLLSTPKASSTHQFSLPIPKLVAQADHKPINVAAFCQELAGKVNIVYPWLFQCSTVLFFE